MKSKRYNRSGQEGMVVMISVIFFLVISFALIVAVVRPIGEQIRASANYVNSAQGYVAAEALNDDALYRLNSGRVLPSTLSLSLNNATSTAAVTDFGTSKQIVATGNNVNTRRSVQSLYSQIAGTSFNYGLQAGTGGISLLGGAGINGSVYSNGDITGSSASTFVTGSAYVANRSDPVLDQTNGTTTPPSYQVEFGGQITGADPRPNDAAQSFKVSTTSPLVSLSLYLKKNSTAWANDITVRIVNNSGSSPGNTTLASATLLASAVPVTQTDTSVSFTTPASLTPGTTYWIVLDTSNSWGNYYSWGAASSTYANGTAKLGTQGGIWASTTPATLDTYFDMYMGGDTGTITSITVGASGGDAHAHKLTDVTISGANLAYCQIATGSTNKPCDTSQADPAPEAFPIVDSLIDSWKADAAAGIVRSTWSIGSSVSTSTTGVMKINGNLTVGGGGTLTLNGNLYVTGNLSLNGGGRIVLGSSFGSAAGVIVVDGTSDLTGGAYISGNGTTGSYVLLVSTNTNCALPTSCTDYAIEQSGGVGSVVLSAQKGGIRFTGGASAKAATANYMTLTGGTTLNYESGLSSINFASGPGGTWSVNNWKEIVQ